MVKVPRNYHVVKSPGEGGGERGDIDWLMVYDFGGHNSHQCKAGLDLIDTVASEISQ